MKVRTGTPSYSEWSGLWKSSPSELDVDRDEYEEVSRKFDHHCRKRYRHAPRFPEDFYVRGDYTGDRTQVVELHNPEVLDVQFLQELQGWLTNSSLSNWRILIPTYLSNSETITVYPEVIRVSDRYEDDLEDGVKRVAEMMRGST